MTPEFFAIEMNRLASVFGGAYKTERAKIIWQEMGNLPEEAFTRIVSKLIGECRQAPMIQEFREASAVEREKLWSKQKSISLAMDQLHEFASCQTCHGTGSVLARRIDDQTPWAFKCRCPAGRNNVRNFPEWQPSHEYKIV